MEILCSRGCGYPVVISTEALDEMVKLGRPVAVQHEVCPNSPEAPQSEYRMRVEVYKEGELVASVGHTVTAGTWEQAIAPLGVALQEQWTRVVGMGTVIDEEPAPVDDDGFDMAGYIGSPQEANELRQAGYGRCKGCGGQEPLEVLQQMNGYCTSECERDHDAD